MDVFLLATITSGVIIVLFAALVLVVSLTVDSDFSLVWARLFGKSMNCLSGKVVWLSGASSGLGEAVALELASIGAKIVLTGNEYTLEHVKEKCLAASKAKLKDDDILTLPPFETQDIEAHEEVVKKVLNHFGKIDILVNNVERVKRAPFDSVSHEEEKESMDINVHGQVNLTKVVLRHFKERQAGQIAVTIGLSGKFARPYYASCNAAKFALIGYFDCLRNEYPYVDITLVCPGPIGTQAKVKKAKNKKRMKVERAAFLYCLALANRMDEVWFALQPILWLFYGAQYFPSTFRRLRRAFSDPAKAADEREGRRKSNEEEV